MTAVLGLVALGSAGLLAGASWALHARRPAALVAPGHATAIAGWAGLTAAAAVVGLVAGNPAHPMALGLLVLAVLGAAVGVAGAARLATLGPGLAHAGAEAGLVGASCVSILWVVAGSPAVPGYPALVALTLTMIDFMSAALIVRLPLAPGVRLPDRLHRPRILTGVTAICALAVADGALTLELLGTGVPAALGPGVRTAACLLAAVVPWLGSGPDGAPYRPSPVARALPYALVASAVGAQLVSAFRAPVGPVSIVLVALVVSALAVVQGLARRENAELVRDLHASRTKLVALVENAGDVILGLDTTGRVLSANGAAVRLLHRAPESMTGLDVAALAVPEDRARLRETVDPVVLGRVSSGRVELRLAAPATGTAELRLQSVAGGAVANLSDVTDAVQLRDRLDRLARFDEMTGLANRTHLLDEISGWLRGGCPVSVLYTDLDGFKAVNDRFGHQCGDDVLAEAARRMQQAVAGLPAQRVVLARIGGDEFVAALLALPAESLPLATERLLAAMRPTFTVADRALRLGVSIGVATTEDTLDDTLDGALEAGAAADLLHRADVAMFAAKQAGRFRVLRWDAAMEARTLRRVDIAIGLRRALDSQRLAIAFQPLVRLSDGAIIGVEALVRVCAEDDGPGALAGLPEIVTPAELVAVAEDTGEIIEMGEWVLGEATAQAARWREAGHDILVTVNVSVRQLAADGFAESVHRALEVARLPAGRLAVEITEGHLLSDQDPAWDTVERLRSLGVVLVIDDFGSGYSSLAYLRHLPVRGIKLDRALLEGLDTDGRARTLVRAVIAAARALGLLVVAEGLETLEAARVVRDLGAYAGQGFALFGALPADAVTRVLAGPPVVLGTDPRDLGPWPSRPDTFAGSAGPVRSLTLDLTGSAHSSIHRQGVPDVRRPAEADLG